MAYVHLEKASDHVHRRVIWWALHKLNAEEYLVQLIQSIYENARSRVRAGCNLSNKFSVKVSVHQGSCLSPLWFIMVLKAHSKEFHIGCPWENRHADDLLTTTEALEELQEKLIIKKTNMEGKGLLVTMGKTKVLISDVHKSSKDHCGVYLMGISTNTGFCGGSSSWIQKKCSGTSCSLKPDPSFTCKRCTG